MSVFIKKSKLRVKNEDGTSYTGVMNAIAEEGTEELIKQIETKGNKTLESIPEDYTALEGNVDKLKEDLANLKIKKINVADYGIKDNGEDVADAVLNLIERFKETLEQIKVLEEFDSSKIYSWWEMLNRDFKHLNENHQDYISKFYSPKT